MGYPTIQCTIMFVDLVDSSVHAKILGIDQYTNRLMQFQKTMQETYSSFVEALSGSVIKGKECLPIKITPRGDEAVVYFTTNKSKKCNEDDVFLAIKLALQMKFAWKKALMEVGGGEVETKQHIELGIGINQGEVAAITTDDMEITNIEGYEINYAKRVESCSRLGKYTNVFLSEKARNVFHNANMIFEKHEDCNLSGIDENVNLYEVREFLFNYTPYHFDEQMKELFNAIKENVLPAFNKTWLEQYMINILYNEFSRTRLEHYKDKIKEIILMSHHPDQIFYKFLKAYFLSDEMILLKLQYYQEIVKERATFILARKEIIRLYEKVYDKLTKLELLSLDVKNYIDDMKNFHSEIIEPDETETYEKILAKINSLL